MVKKKLAIKKIVKSKEKKVSPTRAILTLIINVLILPGLGTIVAKQYKKGTWQKILSLISLPLMWVIIGFPIFIAVWIWALITSIKIIEKAS